MNKGKKTKAQEGRLFFFCRIVSIIPYVTTSLFDNCTP